MTFLEKLVGDKLQAERLVIALERIADSLERGFPPQLQPAVPSTTQVALEIEPDLMIATDETTYEHELEDQFAWLKEAQPEMFEEIRRKLDAMTPENGEPQ